MVAEHPNDQIAVIGMSCRFAPDLTSPERLWSFLVDEQSAISEMPDRRWEPYTGASPEATAILRKTTRKGSFLKDIEGFDAEFFQITPREAEFLDPQQRILLELSWEALGDAGVPPLSLSGTDAGVYVSANSNDYGRRLLEDLTRTGAWAVNGTTYYGIANRISYFLDLHGPSVAVDTACAGSLTALHVACQSLKAAESNIAIVGGINIMASPALVVALDAAGATSPDGRSKAFDKAANGYGRGEGAGVMVLKRLSDAQRDGDRIRAVIVGSGVFQDGRSDGMMAPSSTAQEIMLREVYTRAQVDPASVDYVEAHGTGTTLGDQAEADAMAKVLGSKRPADDPLLFGSLKPNIGHVEAASGIAGAIKVVLALEHGQIPVSPHQEVNPDLRLEQANLRLVDETIPWKNGNGPRRGGVSSYGVGGTISHLILEEAPRTETASEAAAGAKSGLRVFPLSAITEAGLRSLAGDTAKWIREHPEASLDSIARTLTTGRSHLTTRGAVVASTSEELAGLLDQLSDGDRSPRIAVSRSVPPEQAGTVWVFSGHGAQWEGMGRELLRDNPVFARSIDRLSDVFREEMGWTPREVIEAGGPWNVSKVQAMTFAMQVALSDTWHDYGLRPTSIIGHSVGEIAAAAVAGCIDVQDAARFACRRASALERVAGMGAMALVGLSFEQAEERLAGRTDVVAAISASPGSTVVSGDIDSVERLVEELLAEGIDARRVNTDVAFHSPHVDAILDEVVGAARQLSAGEPQVRLYSTALSDPHASDPREGEYWGANLRQPVRFAQAVRAALDDGARLFLEVSSHPVVAHSVRETIQDAGVENAEVATTLRRNEAEAETLLANLALLHCSGAEVAWQNEGKLLSMPVVSWQHRPYWIFSDRAEDSGRGHDPDTHTLLGGRTTVASAPAQEVWQTHLDMSNRPYHQDHKVVGVETVPASVVINSFVAAGARNGQFPGLTDIVLRTPLAATPPRVVQVVLDQNHARLASRIRRDETDEADHAGHDDEWLTHATATLNPQPVVGSRPMEDVETIRSRCPEVWTWEKVDEIFVNMGVEGYTFPWVVEELRRNDHEQLAIVTIDHTPKLHPSSWTAVIDGALTVSGVLVTSENSRILRTSSNLDSIAFKGDPPGRIVVHTTRSPLSPENTIDVLVSDENGNVVCEAGGLKFTQVHDRPGAVLAPRELVHELTWDEVELAELDATAVERVALLGDESITAPLANQLTRRGVSCERLENASELANLSEDQPGVLVVTPTPQQVGEAPELAAERCAWELVEATQHLLRTAGDGQAAPYKLWVLTRGVRDAQSEAALAHAPLWGISRIIAGERPDIWGGIVDLSDETGQIDTDVSDRLLALIAGVDNTEDILSLTPEGVSAARLRQIERLAEGEPLTCRANGTYLVTGGLGGVGLEVARYLVDKGARRLVLAGRRGLPPRSEWDQVEDPGVRAQIDAVLGLEALGTTVRVLSLDISDEAAVAEALDPSSLGLPPICGVIHAAGVVSDALAEKTDRAGLRMTLGPKARGAMVLHRLFPPGTLDFFVLFSSCGQLARLTGQTSYAAANSFMDGLAAFRHAGGHTETASMAWAQWRGTGMGETTAGTTIVEAEARGMGGISSVEAFRSWTFADGFRLPYYAIMRVLPERTLPVFSQLVSAEDSGSEDAGGGGFSWAEVPDDELDDRVRNELHEQVAAELNMSTENIDIDRPLVELGVDSVLVVGLRVRLNRRFGIDLPPTVLWSNPTVRALSEFLATSLRERMADSEEQLEDVA